MFIGGCENKITEIVLNDEVVRNDGDNSEITLTVRRESNESVQTSTNSRSDICW